LELWREASEVRAAREAGQHRLDLLEKPGSVGVGPEEAEDFVQPLNGTHRVKPNPIETAEQRELPVSETGPVEPMDFREGPECGRGHGRGRWLARAGWPPLRFRWRLSVQMGCSWPRGREDPELCSRDQCRYPRALPAHRDR